MLRGVWLAAALGGAIVVACGSDDDGAPEQATAADASAGGTDAAADAPLPCPLEIGARTTIRGLVKILDGTRPPPPAAGARVCIHGRPDIPCVESAADGTYEHACVPDGDVAVLFSHEGTGRTLWLRVLTAGLPQLLDTHIATRAENVKLFGAVGVPYPRPGTGMITLNDSFDSMRGFITVQGPPGVDGPFYSTNGEAIDQDSGPTSVGGVVFMVAPVGDVRVELTADDGRGCQQVSRGWGSRDGGFTLPVLEDTETVAFMGCP